MPKMYEFPRSALRRIQRDAARADIHEVCYLLFGRGRKIAHVVRVPNRATDTVCHSVIADEDYQRVRARRSLQGAQFLGLLHTHPIGDAEPGRGDVKGSKVGALLLVYSDISGELRAFRRVPTRKGYIEKEVLIV